MASYQNVTIVGNLGRDPEVRYAADGTAMASFSVAVSEKWKDKNTGESREETEWFRCVAYRRTAEVIAEYVVKGSSVMVVGKMKTRKYQGRDGVEKTSTELVVDSLQMLGSRAPSAGASEGGYAASAAAPAARRPAAPAAPAPVAAMPDDDPNDIPF